MGIAKGFRKAIEIAKRIKVPTIRVLYPGIYVIECPYCGKRELLNLIGYGSLGDHILQSRYRYHCEKLCVKSK